MSANEAQMYDRYSLLGSLAAIGSLSLRVCDSGKTRLPKSSNSQSKRAQSAVTHVQSPRNDIVSTLDVVLRLSRTLTPQHNADSRGILSIASVADTNDMFDFRKRQSF